MSSPLNCLFWLILSFLGKSFRNPFFFHAFRRWFYQVQMSFLSQVEAAEKDAQSHNVFRKVSLRNRYSFLFGSDFVSSFHSIMEHVDLALTPSFSCITSCFFPENLGSKQNVLHTGKGVLRFNQTTGFRSLWKLQKFGNSFCIAAMLKF